MITVLEEIKGVYKLTRWQEHLGSSFLVTALGLSLASRVTDISITKIIFVLLANFLSFTFSFMINDIEDARDDARDPKKAKRNPISAGILSQKHAYFYTCFTALAGLFFYLSLGFTVFVIGSLSLSLGFLYSWKKVRFKALPVVDVISHALFLGTLEFLAAAVVDNKLPSLPLVMWVGLSLFFVSIFGDIRNELEDFTVDKKAGLRNTSQLLHLYPYRKIFATLNILPLTSLVIYLLFTLTVFNLISFTIICGIIGLFYYFTGYKKGRSFIDPIYSVPLQASLAGVLLTQIL